MRNTIKLIIALTLIISFLSINSPGVFADQMSVNEDLKLLDTDKSNVKILEAKDMKIKVTILNTNMEINKDKIKYVFGESQKAYKEEMKFDENGKQKGTFNFYLADTDAIYFYEQTEDEREPEMVVSYNNQQQALTKITQKLTVRLRHAWDAFSNLFGSDVATAANVTNNVNFPNGFGGRIRIPNTTGNWLFTKVQSPKPSQISVPVSEGAFNYFYIGFNKKNSYGTTTHETDLGLQWSNVYQLWKPYFYFYNNGSKEMVTTFENGYDQVQSVNGFLPSSEDGSVVRLINLTAYRNYQGKVRFKAEGMAKYADKDGNGGNTWLISVQQSSSTPNLTSVSYWKLLNTIATPDGSSDPSYGKSWSKYTGVQIDGTAIPTNNLTFDVESATISVDSSQNLTIDVSR